MPRLLFEKTGNAIWMSHLDLMRVFQRGFKRAGLHLKHTQGFNPRPSVSIALPLSVGVESICELLDFDLDDDGVSCDEILSLLRNSLVDGVNVLEVYESERKIRDLATLRCHIVLEYDSGVPQSAVDEISALFHQEEVLVDKKTKSGMQRQNIIPMISGLKVVQETDHTILLDAVICCQNPSLNPAQLAAAIQQELPHLKPDFYKCLRIELYDKQMCIFR